MPKECILVVEDDKELREAVADTLKLADFKVKTAESGEQALLILEQSEIDMVVSDVNMGGMDGIELLEQIRRKNRELPVVIMTAYADVAKAVAAMRLGAVDFMIKPFEPVVLIDTLKHHVCNQDAIKPVVVDPVSRKLFLLAKKVAVADSTVLLLGESGVGKEVVANFIHEESRRANRPFVAINCAAIPENMLEATMFGYEKGAYTGAYASKPGKFEQAEGGTLLLDEISEMDLGLQAKLLRVLQEREVERLGGKTQRKVNVRVIATTNRNLVDYVKKGSFREDLYYRISVFPLMIESLRNRRQDILPLAEYMVKKYAKRMNHPPVTFDDSAKLTLANYGWPGNVRELENVMQRALILQPGIVVSEADLFLDPMTSITGLYEEISSSPEASAVPLSGEFEPRNNTPTMVEAASPNERARSDSFAGETVSGYGVQTTMMQSAGDQKLAQPVPENLEENLKYKEFQLIIDVLKKEQGSRNKTAEKLGISARTLRYKLAKMRESGIDINAQMVAF